MKKVESLRIKETAYIETLENGLTVIIVPKQNTKKKYVIYGTHFGSIDNHFKISKTNEEIYLPDGVAHFLEHKMFEQENGTNSLDTLMALGVDANAYTTNDHTAYLFEATKSFYEALDELMNYVQHPYFTDENVEKEKGIIGEEITMYDDDPGWQLYMGGLECLYQNNSIKIDIAGSIESISKITPDTLYKAYRTFYNPSNMAIVFCGDFKPEEIIQEVKKRLEPSEEQGKIERIYEKEEKQIAKAYIEKEMQVSTPIFLIGYKDCMQEDMVRRHIAMEILMTLLIGKSSELYQKLYEEVLVISPIDISYEFSSNYAHALISGQSKDPQRILKELQEQIEKAKQGIKEEDFERVKKKIYGDYVAEYNSIADIARMFLQDYFKGINSFDYIEQYKSVTLEYAQQVLKEVFQEKNRILSVIKPKKEEKNT